MVEAAISIIYWAYPDTSSEVLCATGREITVRTPTHVDITVICTLPQIWIFF